MLNVPQFTGSFLFDLSQTPPEKAKKFADRAMQLMPIDMTLETDSISFYRNVGGAAVGESTMRALDITLSNYPAPFEPEKAQLVFVNHNSQETSDAFEALGKRLNVPYVHSEAETDSAKPVLLSLLFDTDFRQQLRQFGDTIKAAEKPEKAAIDQINARLDGMMFQFKRMGSEVNYENRRHWLTQMAMLMNRVLFDKVDAESAQASLNFSLADPDLWGTGGGPGGEGEKPVLH